jgi:hypothetical protein
MPDVHMLMLRPRVTWRLSLVDRRGRSSQEPGIPPPGKGCSTPIVNVTKADLANPGDVAPK